MADMMSTSLQADSSHLRVTAVCISRDHEIWNVRDTPFYNYTQGWKPFQHEQTIERVAYLAERRNKAAETALKLFPNTEHILMIDSYYLREVEQIGALIDEYARMKLSDHPDGCILGASTWIFDKTRIRSRLRFYDGWTTPEGNNLKLREVEQRGGIMRTRAVGGCYVYPRWVWERVHYGVPEDLHGCEHNWLCEHSALPVFLSLNERLWREPIVYPWQKRLRTSLHLGRLIGR